MIKCLRKKKDLTEKYWLLTGYTRAYDYKFLSVRRSKEFNQAYNGDGVTKFVDNDSDSNLTSPSKKSRTYWLNLKEICLHLGIALKLFSPSLFPFECSTSSAFYDKVCLLLYFYCFICPCCFFFSSIFIDDTSLVQLEIMDNKS